MNILCDSTEFPQNERILNSAVQNVSRLLRFDLVTFDFDIFLEILYF